MEQRKTPFPYYLLVVLALLVLLLFLVLQYASGSLFAKEPATIAAAAEDGTVLSWIVEKNTWNHLVYDRESTFVCYDRAGLPPAQLTAGQTVTVTIDGTIPDQVTLWAYALASNEDSVYGDSQPLEELNFYFDGKSGSFTLPAAGGDPILGYLLTCTWGENVCEYGLVVQLLPSE